MKQGSKQPTIILASSSPRRRQLMRQMRLDFTVDPGSVDEDEPGHQTPHEYVQALSLKKASAVAETYSQGLVVGVDTVVVLDGNIMGKPRDDSDAAAMLSRLQGRGHKVYTGLALVEVNTGRIKTDYEFTDVYFSAMNEYEIMRYVASGEPRGKAGAYGIQGLASVFITGINGCYFNVVGLPVFKLAQMLREFGVDVTGCWG